MMTGSIAAFKACALLSKIVQSGATVQVAASAAALRFVGEATLEGLSGRPVAKDLWESGRAMEHIQLVRWADLIIVAPASAHFINRAANGVGDDLLTTMFLAHDFTKPFMIAPAMNTAMYLHPVTKGSITKLRELGIQVLETASGVLACGE
ncbi:MAG: bifunctional phosphopantothenoylcysteine decarboxylase/phosphopantothenate--cysteine ligase CoaBC, partial [Bdellovibrio sp.]